MAIRFCRERVRTTVVFAVGTASSGCTGGGLAKPESVQIPVFVNLMDSFQLLYLWLVGLSPMKTECRMHNYGFYMPMGRHTLSSRLSLSKIILELEQRFSIVIVNQHIDDKTDVNDLVQRLFKLNQQGKFQHPFQGDINASLHIYRAYEGGGDIVEFLAATWPRPRAEKALTKSIIRVRS
ncbi:hypothetical protein HOY80DRAFT_1035526 [Tuber brumale]|nr:hypothetical protein HOY80DRAFT_1035526 [Tuber brumale]